MKIYSKNNMRSSKFLVITNLIICISFFVLSINGYSQALPNIEWQKSLGGNSDDFAQSIQQTTDGGFIVAGYSISTTGDVTGNHGGYDFWVVKLNIDGNIQWEKSLGGSGTDIARSVRQTNDGGYIVAGMTNSTNGDVVGNDGGMDFWIVKLNSNGDLQWQKTYGDTLGGEDAYSIKQTLDGGYIVAGYSGMSWQGLGNGDITSHNGNFDYWVIKLDSLGNLQWQKTLGGSSEDKACDVQQTNDGGFIVTGFTSSSNGNVSGSRSTFDYWVVKLDAVGNIQWEKPLGGSGRDFATSIIQTTDGGYVVGGSRGISGTNSYNLWIVKLDANGNQQWDNIYNSFGNSFGVDLTINNNSLYPSMKGIVSLQQVANGFIVSGATYLNINGVSMGTSLNYWVGKLDDSGNLLWQKALGGNYHQRVMAIQQTLDGGIVVAGSSEGNSGHVTGHHGSVTVSDYWVVKLAPENLSLESFLQKSINIFPNPVNNRINLDRIVKSIKITDISGKVIGIYRDTDGVEVSDLIHGIYFLTFELENGVTETKKIIKI